MDPTHNIKNEQITSVKSFNVSQLESKEELKCLINAIKLHKSKCLGNTVILESLKECLSRSEKHHVPIANENNLPATVVNKVAKLMCMERLCGNTSVTKGEECVNDNSLNLLGLSCEYFTSLGSGLLGVEKQFVRSVGEQHLQRKQRRHPMKKFVAETASSNNQDIKNGIVKENVLSDLVLQNHIVLQHHWTELKQLLEVRQSFLQHILPQKVSCLENQLEMCQAQKRCLDAALLDIILNEMPRFPKALKLVYRQMKEDNDALVLEIERLKNIRAAYQTLKGTKFDMLLKNYRTVLKEIEHVNWGLQNLK